MSDGRRHGVPLLRIFLSSPGSVAEEREAARQLIVSELLRCREGSAYGNDMGG